MLKTYSVQEIRDEADKMLGASNYNSKTSTPTVARYGSKSGSVKVELTGEKAGLWFDFAKSEGGTVFGQRYDKVYEYKEGFVSRSKNKQIRPHTLGPEGWQSKAPARGFSLYRLEHLNETGPVLIVEGEKTCDKAANLLPEFSVLTWQGGTGNVAKVDLAPLALRNVSIWPDADDAGQKAAETLSQRLLDLGAQVSVVDVSDIQAVAPKWDLADEIPEGIDIHVKLDNAKQRCELSLFDNALSGAELLTATYPEIEWVLPNLLPKGLAMLAAPPKTGKSWLALEWCYQAVLNGHDALYLALEDSDRRINARLKLAGKTREASKLGKINFWAGYKEDGRQIPVGSDAVLEVQRHLRLNPNTKLVVIDTMRPVMTSNRAGSKSYDEWVNDLRPWVKIASNRACILFIHHTRKKSGEADENPFETILGSQGIMATIDTVAVLVPKVGSKDALVHITGKDVEDAEFFYEWLYPSFTEGGDAKRKSLGSTQHLFYNYTEQYPGCTQADIIQTFRMDKGQVSKVISRLVEMGMVRKGGEHGNQLFPIN
jgi:hypothetical protein